ncbi:MAG: SGNH/GDSL hydrolase family protein [Myxococcaceae bacterium]
MRRSCARSWAVVALLGAGCAALERPTLPRPQFIGRFDYSDPAGPRFSWAGTAIVARFYGTDLDVRLRETSGGTDRAGNPHRNHYQVWVDGTPTEVLVANPDRERYPVARGLSMGEHTVMLTKRTEPLVGEGQFLGFELPNGGYLLPPPQRPALRMEFIGDSIVAGYGVEGEDRFCGFSAGTQNHGAAYGALAARMLGAEQITIAWSGTGIWRNYDGSFEHTMPELYSLARAPSTAQWDFARWTPHIVAIHLGTNDFARTNVDRRAFVSSYLKFLESVRSKYPDAHILVLMGPMLTDTFPTGQASKTLARTYLNEVVDTARAAGDDQLSFLEFPEQGNDYGCDWHPSKSRQARMANTLVNEIRSRLIW